MGLFLIVRMAVQQVGYALERISALGVASQLIESCKNTSLNIRVVYSCPTTSVRQMFRCLHQLRLNQAVFQIIWKRKNALVIGFKGLTNNNNKYS